MLLRLSIASIPKKFICHHDSYSENESNMLDSRIPLRGTSFLPKAIQSFLVIGTTAVGVIA